MREGKKIKLASHVGLWPAHLGGAADGRKKDLEKGHLEGVW